MGFSSEWHTPPEIIERARAVLGVIDLDPASCAGANKRVGAGRFIDAADNGLGSGWAGPNTVFLNPPSPALPWWARLMEHLQVGRLLHGVFVAFNAELLQTSQGRPYPSIASFPLCAPAHRIRYLRPDGSPGTSPRHHSLIVYVPGAVDRRHRFADVFSDYGAILLPGGGG
jgi:ParB family chromosome partitioning protein